MLVKATPYAAGLATLCSIATLVYACEVKAGADEFRLDVARIAAADGAKRVEVDAGTACDKPDEQLLEAEARAARDAFEVKARRALVALERARVLDRDADIVDLDAAEARLAGARAHARSDRVIAADAASFATARCAPRVGFKEPAVAKAPPVTKVVLQLPQQYLAALRVRSYPSPSFSIPSRETQTPAIDMGL